MMTHLTDAERDFSAGMLPPYPGSPPYMLAQAHPLQFLSDHHQQEEDAHCDGIPDWDRLGWHYPSRPSTQNLYTTTTMPEPSNRQDNSVASWPESHKGWDLADVQSAEPSVGTLQHDHNQIRIGVDGTPHRNIEHSNNTPSFPNPDIFDISPHTRNDQDQQGATNSFDIFPPARQSHGTQNQKRRYQPFDHPQLPPSPVLSLAAPIHVHHRSRDAFRRNEIVQAEESLGDVPYAKLIYSALSQAPGYRMVLKDIYHWIEQNTGKAADPENTGWQNSVRHNLSMNQAFTKVPHTSKDSQGKRCYIWVLNDHAVRCGIQPTTRYRRKDESKKRHKGRVQDMQRQESGRRGGHAASRSAKAKGGPLRYQPRARQSEDKVDNGHCTVEASGRTPAFDHDASSSQDSPGEFEPEDEHVHSIPGPYYLPQSLPLNALYKQETTQLGPTEYVGYDVHPIAFERWLDASSFVQPFVAGAVTPQTCGDLSMYPAFYQ